MFTAASFLFFGPSIFAARLVSVLCSVLTVITVYAVANLLLENKSAALLAALFFSVGPGIMWLSKSAMIETLLAFVFSLCMYYFFRWLKTNSMRDQALCIAAFAVGVLVKYQVLVIAPIIMLAALAFWKRNYLRQELGKWARTPRIAVIAVAVAVLSVAAVLLVSSKTIDYYLYAFGVGSQEKAFFSARYPLPVFYLIEMTWFSDTLHPVSLLLYGLGLAGLVWVMMKGNSGGKKLLLWFIVVYVVFTLVPNREWRYVTIAFPVLAIAAATLVVSVWGKLRKVGASEVTGLRRGSIKLGAAGLIALSVGAVAVSCADDAVWIGQYSVEVPVEQASVYVRDHIGVNQTLVVACAVNHFSKYMVMFYFSIKDSSRSFNDTCQTYPNYAMDSFNPGFNVTALSELCSQNNTAYVMLYEYGGLRYFQSDLTALKVANMLNQTGAYRLEQTFGEQPNRLFVYAYTGQK